MRKHPLHLLWERLKNSLNIASSARQPFELDLKLFQTLQGMAEQEQRSAEDIAADLLSLALDQQQACDELIQRWRSLSSREEEVAALTCLNLTNRQIAARLGISPETVKTHVRNVLHKFGLHSKAELRLLLNEWDFSAWD